MEQLRQRIIAAYHLEPLTFEETRAYIEYRLGRVGWAGDPELEGGIFPEVHERTGGVPRRINALCDRLLLFGCIEGKHALTAADLRLVAAEMQEEVGRPETAALADARTVRPIAAPAADMQIRASALGEAECGDEGLAVRVAALEAEVARLRATVQHERKLLRKAVLMQLDLDAYDELD
jgi:general secretion pathway protein A